MLSGCSSASASRVPKWVAALDAITLVLLGLSALVALTGGIRTYVTAGFRLSITSPARLVLWALMIAAARHIAYRRVTLLTRVNESGVGARLRSSGLWRQLLEREGPWVTAGETRRHGWRIALEYGAVGVLLTVLTLLMTYPHVIALDKVRDMGDPLFSIWRLSWVAHQLPRDPVHLFDANIFYPAKHTLALSDSLLLPAFVAAPFLWLGISATKVVSVFFLASFVLSGLAMYALAKALTGQRPAALVAAVAFAFYPFRFEHYSHFELQLSFWMPLVLLSLHRVVRTRRVRDGLVAGAALAAQIYSCMYFGVFLAAFLVPVAVVLFLGTRDLHGAIRRSDRRVARPRPGWADRGRAFGRTMRPFVAGAVLAALLVAPLALQYLSARQQFGGRTLDEVRFFSATRVRYLAPHQFSATWGSVNLFGHLPEQDLFPGLLLLVLAIVGVWPPLNVSRIAYTCGLLFAFDVSLGVNGRLYPWLYEYLAPFRSIRVPARMSMVVGLSLAILACYGVARLTAWLKKPATGYALAGLLCAVLCFEARPVLAFEEPCKLHAIYGWFHGRPTAVIAELPTPGDVIERLWQDVRYEYFSTFHWNTLLNGNSGILPAAYLNFSRQMTTFPDEDSLALLRRSGAQYVVVHEEFYGDAAAYRRVVEASAGRADLVEVARAVDRGTEARVYKLLR